MTINYFEIWNLIVVVSAINDYKWLETFIDAKDVSI